MSPAFWQVPAFVAAALTAVLIVMVIIPYDVGADVVIAAFRLWLLSLAATVAACVWFREQTPK